MCFIPIGRFFTVIFAYSAERNNYYFFEEEGRQTAFTQLIFSLTREILTLSGEGRGSECHLPPHFFCLDFKAKKYEA